jgi:hypothetical protein
MGAIERALTNLNRTFYRLRQSSIDEELFDAIAGFNALSHLYRRHRGELGARPRTHLRTKETFKQLNPPI